MNYSKISKKINKINKELFSSIENLKKDELFISNKENITYLKEDKIRISKKWTKIKYLFKELKKIIRNKSFKLFFNKNNNDFVIKHYCIFLYYNAISDMQKTFGNHENFIRQFLDEQHKLNYSKIAKYMYRINFAYFINYPQSFINTMKNKVDKDLIWMLDTKKDYTFLGKRFVLDKVNIFYYIKYRFSIILYFFVKYIGLFMSKIKITIRKKGLVSKENREKYLNIAKKGDILLSRKNWVGTNVSIPGFWKHMAMFVGNGEYLKENFKNKHTNKLENKKNYIIESTSKGVQFLDFDEYCDELDYLGAIRTNFSKEKIFKAIKQTINLINKDYDYSFNYYSDSSFVCSELITKAYLKENNDDEGLNIILEKVGIGITYPPNNIIKKTFEEININNKQLEPIFFIDSIDKKNINFINNNNELLQSWKRSRFSFFLK